MASTKTPRTETGGMKRAVQSFVELTDKMARGDHIGVPEAKSIIKDIAALASPGRIDDAKAEELAEMITLVIEMRAPTPNITSAVDLHGAVDTERMWETHRDKQSGKATHYTLTLEGYKLRVDRVKEAGHIQFVGFIDGSEVARGSSRVVIRKETASIAQRMAVKRVAAKR